MALISIRVRGALYRFGKKGCGTQYLVGDRGMWDGVANQTKFFEEVGLGWGRGQYKAITKEGQYEATIHKSSSSQ